MPPGDALRLSQLMLEFYEKMSSWEHAVVKQSGLSPAQMHTVEIIGHHGSLQMKDLALKMGVTTGTLTVMIDRLESMGLVERTPHESDRRSYNTLLTAAGRHHYEDHHKRHLELTLDLTAALPAAETMQFITSLEKLLERF
jgi:DNA-binding MarR family transcriptional regulator